CRNGLGSPLGIETDEMLESQGNVCAVGMACGARSGLKLYGTPSIQSTPVRVGMACGARSGLKLYGTPSIQSTPVRVGMACGARWGLNLYCFDVTLVFCD